MGKFLINIKMKRRPSWSYKDMKAITCVFVCAYTVCLELVTDRGGVHTVFVMVSVQNVQNMNLQVNGAALVFVNSKLDLTTVGQICVNICVLEKASFLN